MDIIKKKYGNQLTMLKRSNFSTHLPPKSYEASSILDDKFEKIKILARAQTRLKDVFGVETIKNFLLLIPSFCVLI